VPTARQQTASPAGGELRAGTDIDRSPLFPTVTVRPFDSLADDVAQVYLARGITADLTTDLSRLAGLRVIGASRVAGGSALPPAELIVSATLLILAAVRPATRT
jgi:TolB-like protein